MRRVLPFILLAFVLTACTPTMMLSLHRHRSPDGPYQRSECASPEETPSGRWDCPGPRVDQLRREAAAMRRAVHRAWVAQHSCSPGNPDGCAAVIRRVFAAHGLDPEAAVRVAICESGLSPTASNGGRYLGLFQQMASAWGERSARYGVGGRSVFDGEANAIVSAGMVRDDGDWGQWECKP